MALATGVTVLNLVIHSDFLILTSSVLPQIVMHDVIITRAVYQNTGMQMPMFASANHNPASGGVDDVDLHEIFADYFAEASDTNGATQAMQLSNGGTFGVAALSQQQQAVTAGLALPAGQGVKTAWPTGTLPATGGVIQQQQQVIAPPRPAALQPSAPQPAGSQPAPKRVKMEELLFLPSDTPLPDAAPQADASAVNAQQQQHQQQLAAGAGAAGAVTGLAVGGGSSLTGRLGFFQQQQQIQQDLQQQPLSISGVGGVSLPVRTGIKIGGAGGVASGAGLPAGMVGGAAGAALPMGGVQWGAVGNPCSSAVSHIQYAAPMQGDQASMEEAMTAERRLRNREHAKRSRVRKKFMLESLQQQVWGLQKENSTLRMLVQKRIPQHALKIIDESCSKSPLFGGGMEAGFSGMKGSHPGDGAQPNEGGGEKVELVKSDFSLIESLTSGQQNFVLSDPRLPDNPIVFASPGFYELTGYTREQVLGRNCRFLQGPGTDPRAVDVIRTAIAGGTDATMCLLNYKADGTPFWNQFFVAALRDADNCIVNYVGVQTLVEPNAGTSALEDKVNAAMPLKLGEDEDEDD